MQKTLYIPIDTTFDFTFECPLLVKKYDTLKLKIAIFDKGLLKDLTEQTVNLVLRKADGTNIEKTIADKTLNIASIVLDKQASSCAGKVQGEVIIADSTGQTTTNTFVFNVSNSLTEDVDIKSKDDIETLEDMRAIIAAYRNEIQAIGESTQATEALNNITAYIESNLSELTSKNATAVKNILDLKAENDRADYNIPALKNENENADDKLDKFRLYDTTNLIQQVQDNTSSLNDIGQQKANKVAIPPVYMGVFFESNENTGNNIFLTGDGKNLIKINDNNIFNSRDTSVMACNGKFYFASTNSNEINKIVINATSDLENYETTFITLNNDTNLAVWAPDWFIDDDGKIYILYSLQVGTELGGDSVTYKDMRQYIVEIADLETLTIGTPRALNLTGDSKNSDNRIDGTIVKKDGTYYLFIKYNSMTGDGNPNGAIEIWTSTDLVVWTCINERINDLMGLEAPCICKINDIYYLYVDDFIPFNYADSSLVSNGGATMYLTSTDLVTWSSTPVMVNSSVSLRHGSIVQIYDEDCKRVILSKSLPKLLNLNYENQSRVKTLESLTDLTGIYNNIQFIMSASTAYGVYRGFIPLKNASNYTITLTKMAYMDTDVVEVTSTATIGEKNALGFMVHNTNANVAGKVCLLWFKVTK